MEVPSKREALERLLDQGMVMVHVDARRPGVRVPQAHRGDPQLRLNLSYRFSSRDLSLTDEYVRCTLSFGGRPFYVELPLAAVFAVTSHVTGEALVWPDSIGFSPDPAATATRPALTSVSAPRDLALAEDSPPPVARGSHLRLVK